VKSVEVNTEHGPAVVRLHPAAAPSAALVLGHGASGGVDAPDLVAATEVAIEEGFSVALVEQPYRVAGRKSPAPAKQLETAWVAVVEQLREGELSGLPLVVGGRSIGARVACRTVEATGPVAVLCLAFPLQPKRRNNPPPSRLPELEAVEVPVLVVQGEKDQFGMPPEGSNREVAVVPGNHGLKTDVGAVADAVRAWLPRFASEPARAAS
jgi:uncharacterized protein